MANQTLIAKIIGKNGYPLLQNNPQTVDRFNPYAKAMKRITDKNKRRTDEDYREHADIEVRSRVHWSETLGGVVVPTTWVLASLCKVSHKIAKIAKGDIRGMVFPTEPEVLLHYRDMELVKTLDDIVGNPVFRHSMNIKQNQARVVKSSPIFHNWRFTVALEFDDKDIDPKTLEKLIEYGAFYGGYGDFRPTFGRATAEITHV